MRSYNITYIQNKRTILWRCIIIPLSNLPNAWVMVCERLSTTCDRFGDLTYFALKNRVDIEWIHRINLTTFTYALLLMGLYLPYQMHGARELWCAPQYSAQYHRFFNWCLVHHEFWKVEFCILSSKHVIKSQTIVHIFRNDVLVAKQQKLGGLCLVYRCQWKKQHVCAPMGTHRANVAFSLKYS